MAESVLTWKMVISPNLSLVLKQNLSWRHWAILLNCQRHMAKYDWNYFAPVLMRNLEIREQLMKNWWTEMLMRSRERCHCQACSEGSALQGKQTPGNAGTECWGKWCWRALCKSSSGNLLIHFKCTSLMIKMSYWCADANKSCKQC